jgi:hypothetical protein
MDAVNAFLNAELPEPVYCSPPDGYQNNDQVIKVSRALYGFKESGNL